MFFAAVLNGLHVDIPLSPIGNVCATFKENGFNESLSKIHYTFDPDNKRY